MFAGEYGSIAPIAAVVTATGYDVAWKVPGANQYVVWTVDGNGNETSNATGGSVSGSSAALENFETIFHQDLNGDGVVGAPIAAKGNATPLSKFFSVSSLDDSFKFATKPLQNGVDALSAVHSFIEPPHQDQDGFLQAFALAAMTDHLHPSGSANVEEHLDNTWTGHHFPQHSDFHI